jgi:hypothetical protein
MRNLFIVKIGLLGLLLGSVFNSNLALGGDRSGRRGGGGRVVVDSPSSYFVRSGGSYQIVGSPVCETVVTECSQPRTTYSSRTTSRYSQPVVTSPTYSDGSWRCSCHGNLYSASNWLISEASPSQGTVLGQSISSRYPSMAAEKYSKPIYTKSGNTYYEVTTGVQYVLGSNGQLRIYTGEAQVETPKATNSAGTQYSNSAEYQAALRALQAQQRAQQTTTTNANNSTAVYQTLPTNTAPVAPANGPTGTVINGQPTFQPLPAAGDDFGTVPTGRRPQ